MLSRTAKVGYAIGFLLVAALLSVVINPGGFIEGLPGPVLERSDVPVAGSEPKTLPATPAVAVAVGSDVLGPKASLTDPASHYRSMHTSRNLRKFVHDARNSTLGTAYAMQAVFECGAIRDLFEPPGGVRAETKHPNAGTAEEKAAARESLLTKCQDFTKDELSASKYSMLASQAKRSSLYAAYDRLRDQRHSQGKNDREVIESLLNEIFLSGDPLLIGNALKGQWRFSSTGPDGFLFIDGKPVPELTYELHEQSVHLAVCTLTNSCGESTLQTEFACAIGHVCSPSLNAFVDAGWDEKPRQLIRQVAVVFVEVVRSLQAKRIMAP